jgi:anti-sigma B factor antagonist
MTASSTELTNGNLTRGDRRFDTLRLTRSPAAIYAFQRHSRTDASPQNDFFPQATEKGQTFDFSAVRLKEKIENGVDVFALEGEIDLHFGPVLRTMLQGKLKGRCPALVLDFSDVEFIDSRGIAAIIEYHRDCVEFGGKIALAALNPTVKPIIDIVRLETVMPIYESVAQATAAMKPDVAGKPL